MHLRRSLRRCLLPCLVLVGLTLVLSGCNLFRSAAPLVNGMPTQAPQGFAPTIIEGGAVVTPTVAAHLPAVASGSAAATPATATKLMLPFVGSKSVERAAAFAAPAAPTPAAHKPGVADLLRNRPAAGKSVEVDAYFSGAGVSERLNDTAPNADEVLCPSAPSALLTDRPFPATLSVLNGIQSNSVPVGISALIATVPEAAKPGVQVNPQLPYHARLKGHFGDPAFAHCKDNRIFVVESVAKVYEETLPDPSIYALKLPADYAAWQRYHDERGGYSLPYPADWKVARVDNVTVALRNPKWSAYPVTVVVHKGETVYDQNNPEAISPLLKGKDFSVFTQGLSFGSSIAGGQGLSGYRVDTPDTKTGALTRAVSVLFSANGYTYELALRYPLGFDAPQSLLTAYTTVVEGFALDTLPQAAPTEAVNQTLGKGPFLTEEQAVFYARRKHAGIPLYLQQARLVSEAEARDSAQAACKSFEGHPAGVWMLVVQGSFEGKTQNMLLILDATDGAQLCSEEVVSASESAEEATPEAAETPVPPTATATPVASSDTGGTTSVAQPPAALLSVGAQEQVSGVGTYCWSEQTTGQDSTGLCADMVGIPTVKEPLEVYIPFTVTLRLPLTEAPTELQLEAIPVTGASPLDKGSGGYEFWAYKSGQVKKLDLAQQQEIALDLDPGLYVFSVFARWPGRDVNYGFLVEVQEQLQEGG